MVGGQNQWSEALSGIYLSRTPRVRMLNTGSSAVNAAGSRIRDG